MSGTFFKNLFDCSQFMNNTCDPERQVNRWIRCNDTSNQKSKLNRVKYDNGNVDNDDKVLNKKHLKSMKISELREFAQKRGVTIYKKSTKTNKDIFKLKIELINDILNN